MRNRGRPENKTLTSRWLNGEATEVNFTWTSRLRERLRALSGLAPTRSYMCTQNSVERKPVKDFAMCIGTIAANAEKGA